MKGDDRCPATPPCPPDRYHLGRSRHQGPGPAGHLARHHAQPWRVHPLRRASGRNARGAAPRRSLLRGRRRLGAGAARLRDRVPPPADRGHHAAGRERATLGPGMASRPVHGVHRRGRAAKRQPRPASPRRLHRRHRSVRQRQRLRDWADWVPAGKVGVTFRRVEGVDALGFARYGGEPIHGLVDKDRYGERGDVETFDSLGAVRVESTAPITKQVASL